MQLDWQHILVYIILAGAVFYLVRKFLWPARRPAGKDLKSGCGNDDCGCH